jgi:threonine synthase
MPTNGNAGAAWSLYAARAGLRSLITMPMHAPEITQAECVIAGAELYLVDGLIGDASTLIAAAVAEREGYQNVSTLKEPYRIEGKKTMGYEIVEQLGWRTPDVIFYPTGGGVGIIGIYKALLELRELGWLSGELPRLVAVQATGCAPIVEAFQRGAVESVTAVNAHTVASGLNVPKAVGDFLVLNALRQTGGTSIAVTDQDLLAAQQQLARSEGIFVCPEGAACFAAVGTLRSAGWLRGDETVVVLNTGTGIKYPNTVTVKVLTLPQNGRIPPEQ